MKNVTSSKTPVLAIYAYVEQHNQPVVDVDATAVVRKSQWRTSLQLLDNGIGESVVSINLCFV